MYLLTYLITYIKQEAMLSCYQMLVNGQWVQTYCGHSSIKYTLAAHASLSQMKSDKTFQHYTLL